MAGMFYSLKEASEKLGKTEEEVKRLSREGKLREFRDGSNIMYKISEVEALIEEETPLPFDESPQEESVLEQELDSLPDLGVSEESEPGLEALAIEQEPGEALKPEPAVNDMEFLPEEPLNLDPVKEQEEIPEESLLLEPESDTKAAMPLEKASDTSEPESSEDIDQLLALEGTGSLEASEVPEFEGGLDIDSELESLMPDADSTTPEDTQGEHVESSDTQVLSQEQITKPTDSSADEEISLAPEGGSESEEKPLTDIDTALTGEGVSVLGETDDYKLTDDTMAETMASFAGTGEASQEEIEEDVNLDSFGSGSGLLDLSLQADDTSLGGILDEIYTKEGEEGAAPAEMATTEDVVAEADHLRVAEDMGTPSFGEPTSVTATSYMEPAPDAQSNTFGAMLFLPLAILIYTTIVVWAAIMGVVPFILTSIQGLIWILMGGACVASMIIAGMAFVKGSDRGSKPKKVKEKKIKPKKEKKKKEKKPEDEKT